MKKFGLLLFILIFPALIFSQSTIYNHDFGITTITTHPYTVDPPVFDVNLSNSSWSNSTGAWISYIGSSGQAISLSNSGGTPTITVTFDVSAGYQMTINQFNFWCRRSSTGAEDWSMTINGIAVGLGAISSSGAFIGVTNVANSVNNQTGTITILISLSGATGAGTFRIDDFELIGTVSTIASPTITVNPTSLSGFLYIEGSGPSSEQSFDINGSNLTDNISITPPTNYEISTGTGGSFVATNPITLTQSGGTVSSTTIYVRLKAGLSAGTYNGENISATSTGATTQNVTCSGSVIHNIVITEIHDHPTFEYEYVEIFNNSASSIDLTGWKLLQNNSSQTTTLVDVSTNVLEGSITLSSGNYAIFFRGTTSDYSSFKTLYSITGTLNAFTNSKTSNSSGSPQINGSETYRLEDASSNLVDYFGDYIGGASPTFSVTSGERYERQSYPNDGTASSHWATFSRLSTGGSPGSENSTPLPVELSSFSAVVLDNGVKLNWRTETEVSNYGFEVQRSEFGPQSSEFRTLGFVEGHGNSNSPKEYSFVDNKISASVYSYRLKQIDNDGKFEYSKVIEIDVGTPIKYELSQNYPNPFNPSTTIEFSIPKTGNVKLLVYNILGEKVATLLNEVKEAGVYTVNFNASEIKSGIYFYKIEAHNFITVKKMQLVK